MKAPARHILVDGDDVLQAVPSLKAAMDRDVVSARERFIDAVADFSRETHQRITVVFDGKPPEPSASRTLHAPVHVVFSHPVTAEEKLRTLIDRSDRPQQLIIISSNRELLRFSSHHSCETHTASYFAKILADRDDLLSEKTDAPLTPEQIKEWLKLFDRP